DPEADKTRLKELSNGADDPEDDDYWAENDAEDPGQQRGTPAKRKWIDERGKATKRDAKMDCRINSPSPKGG
ncbi:hypothetical protein DYB25_012070, partial [Aphanomyces astaci]